MAQGQDSDDKKDLGGIGARLGRGVREGMSSQQKRPGREGIKREVTRAGEQAGKGLSATPPAAPTPSTGEDERLALSNRASSLQGQLNSLRSEASLAGIRGRLGDLDSTLSTLPAALEEVRQGGYVYKAFLENKIQVLREQWQGLRGRIDTEAAQQGRVLTQQADSLQRRLSAMGTNLSAVTLDALERDVSALQGKVDDVVHGLEGTFETLYGNTSQTERQIQTIRWVLEQVNGATFGLRPDEYVVEATEAQYLTDGDDGPKGLLFVTDQRLLFEQKEEVATKKVLFITTEKELVHKLLLEAPIGAVQAQASESGALLWKKELLQLSLSHGDVSKAVFRLGEDSERWPALLGRVRSGEIVGERIEGAAVEEQAVSAVAAAPSVCPTCGATMTTEIVRGMQSITCEYCGTVVRL